MDKLYKVNDIPWISDEINLSTVAAQMQKHLSDILNNAVLSETIAKPLDNDTLRKSALRELTASYIPKEEFELVANRCRFDDLVCEELPVMKNLAEVKAQPTLMVPQIVLPDALKFEVVKRRLKIKNENKYDILLKYRSCVWTAPKAVPYQDLCPLNDFVANIRIYYPFRYNNGSRISQPPKCSQEIMVLGSNLLTELRDKITCVCDGFVSVELSRNPEVKDFTIAKDQYKSGFFFISNTFYNDMRDPCTIDTSENIHQWAKTCNISPLNSKKMEGVKIMDLAVKLGEPYLYQHQGNCEHLVVFSDIRLLHGKDNLSSKDYPKVDSVGHQKAKYCHICNIYVAKYVTVNHNRMMSHPAYFCDVCFFSYNYVDGNKVGNFEAYRIPSSQTTSGLPE